MIKVSENKLKELVYKGKPVLTFAHTDWCSECRRLKPVIEAVEAQFASKVVVADIDADSVSDNYIRDFGVDELPTLNIVTEDRIFDPCVDKYDLAGISAYIEKCLA
ncbi:MAG: thioredoxin family protein [Candidatus Riflebacteria bacterium]|nr:thioredoxin family protein [Candidatus Riflebacteria bacterium]